MAIQADELTRTKIQALNLYQNGALMEALQACRAACADDDHDPVMYCLMGVIYGQLNQYAESARYSRRAIELNPEYIEAHFNLALAARQIGEIEQAIKSLEFVVAHSPRDPDAHYSLANILEGYAEYDRAMQEYRLARSINPDHLDALAGEASIHEKRGDFDTAWQIIRPHVEGVELASIMMAIVYGRLALAGRNPEAALPRLRKYLESHSLPNDHRLLLQFTLGALCDKVGRYDEAFNHYRQANEIKGVWFDRMAFHDRIDGIIGNFSKERLAHSPRSECASDRPIFIVGMLRSGTSLVEQILSSHSAVFGAGELPHLERIVMAMEGYGRDITRQTVKQLTGHAGRYLDEISRLNDDARFVTDKMPQNFLHLGYIELMFPNARVIHCRRNPLDTCLSCYFQNFAEMQAHTFDLETLGNYYAQYRRLIDHWKRVLTIPVYEVSYEHLVSSPESSIEDLLAFCGLQAEPACFSFHKSRRAVRTASYSQVRRPMYASSVNRWRRYEKHLEPLIGILGR